MKKSKKRDPKREPFPSSISDNERHLLVKNIVLGAIDDIDTEMLFGDFERATRKIAAAAADGNQSLDIAMKFYDAQASASSAAVSVATMMPAVQYLYESGVTARKVWRRGGKARHDAFSDEAIYHESWKRLRLKILTAWPHARKPSERRLAQLIEKQHPEHPPFETVRGYFRRQKKKLG